MNAMMWRAPLALLVVGALAACGSVPKRQATPVAAEVAQVSAQAQAAEQQRQVTLLAQPNWSFQGRVAISKGRNGGNGRIDWLQRGPAYQVSLAAPVTRQSWQLSGGEPGQTVRLDGLEGGPRTADDAGQLLLQATGWEIPVAQLAEWVRGLPSAGASPEHLGFDAEGRPRVLRQQGWQVDYLDWYPAEAGRPSLPRRIEAVNGDAKVRLIVDEWGMDAP